MTRRRLHSDDQTDLAMLSLEDVTQRSQDEDLLARAQGFGFQTKDAFLQHVRVYQEAKAAQECGDTVDEDPGLVHIRCGSDLAEGLKQAGFAAPFLEFSDPVCQGPLRDPYDFAERGRFLEIYEAQKPKYGTAAPTLPSGPEPHKTQYESLINALSAEQWVIWSEADPYDIFVLIRLFHIYNEQQKKTQTDLPKLDVIAVDHFPDIPRFTGLGQLSPAGLRFVWTQNRQPVSQEAILLGDRLWRALCAESPLRFNEFLQPDACHDFPFFGPAVQRWAQDYPWVSDGLTKTERLALEAVASGVETASALFGDLIFEKEPLVFLGDIMFWPILEGLMVPQAPLLAIEAKADLPWIRQPLSLTPLGKAILAEKEIWQGRQAEWRGGVLVSPEKPWRYDSATQSLVMRRS